MAIPDANKLCCCFYRCRWNEFIRICIYFRFIYRRWDHFFSVEPHRPVVRFGRMFQCALCVYGMMFSFVVAMNRCGLVVFALQSLLCAHKCRPVRLLTSRLCGGSGDDNGDSGFIKNMQPVCCVCVFLFLPFACSLVLWSMRFVSLCMRRSVSEQERERKKKYFLKLNLRIWFGWWKRMGTKCRYSGDGKMGVTRSEQTDDATQRLNQI